MSKKKIPCRVCGKEFEPCAYCQTHADVFRWRNFACSKECAVEYINAATAYRESLRNKENISFNVEPTTIEDVAEKQIETVFEEKQVAKKRVKRVSMETSDDIVSEIEE